MLIDHAWGREPCTIADIKSYKSKTKSVSFSQVLMRDYTMAEARIIVAEMCLNGCQEMMRRRVITNRVAVFIGYSRSEYPSTGGTAKMSVTTNVYSCIKPYVLEVFDKTTNPEILIRNIAICFENVCDEGCEGYDLFTDFNAIEKEKNLEHTVLRIKDKYGKNAMLRGLNFEQGSTQRERNTFIGGHKAGIDDTARKS